MLICVFWSYFPPSPTVRTINSTPFSKCLPAATYKCTRPPLHANVHSCSMRAPTHTQTHAHVFKLTSSRVPDWLSLLLSSRAFCNRDSSPWRQHCSCRGGIVTSSTLSPRQWARTHTLTYRHQRWWNSVWFLAQRNEGSFFVLLKYLVDKEQRLAQSKAERQKAENVLYVEVLRLLVWENRDVKIGAED